MASDFAFKEVIESFRAEGTLLELFCRGEGEHDFAVGIVVATGDTSFIYAAFKRDGVFSDFRWLEYSNVEQIRVDTVYLRQYQRSVHPDLPASLEPVSLSSVLNYLSQSHEVCSVDNLRGGETLGIIRKIEGDIVFVWEIAEGAPNGEVLLSTDDIGEIRFGSSVHAHLGKLVR